MVTGTYKEGALNFGYMLYKQQYKEYNVVVQDACSQSYSQLPLSDIPYMEGSSVITPTQTKACMTIPESGSEE